MISFFTKSAVGYSHLSSFKPCQDYSASYHDEERTIITACDGHGGDLYVRSHLGSKFASDAALNVLKSLTRADFFRLRRDEISNSVRLKVLCEWNTLVSAHLSKKRLTHREIAHLSAEKQRGLRKSPEQAYGTTLNAAMIYANKLVCVSIGDGGIFAVKGGAIKQIFEDDDEAVANLTYSMCREDAYDHISVGIFDFQSVDGVILCTDGVINPYRSLENFNKSLVNPIVTKLAEEKRSEIDAFITKLGSELGIGDDVTLSVAIKSSISLRGYRK